MGYAIQQNAPQITINGRTFAMSDTMTSTIIGVEDRFGLFELVNGEWDASYDPDTYINAGECVAAVKAQGGIAQFTKNLFDNVNKWLAAQGINTSFSAPISTQPDPTDDAQVIAEVQQTIASGSFAKQPLPAAMQAALAEYWASAVSTIPVRFDGFELVRQGTNLALFAGDDGTVVSMTPQSDPNVIAKKMPALAAAWKAAYGFVPQ